MDDLKGKVNEKLQHIGESPDSIKDFMVTHLLELEEYIYQVEQEYNQALESLKLKSLTVKSVAKHFEISRTTVYNHNQLLKRYLEYSVQSISNTNPYDNHPYLKETITDQKRELDLLYERDIKNELLKHEINKLSSRLRNKDEEINRLEKRNIELSRDIQDTKNTLRKVTASNVIDIQQKI